MRNNVWNKYSQYSTFHDCSYTIRSLYALRAGSIICPVTSLDGTDPGPGPGPGTGHLHNHMLVVGIYSEIKSSRLRLYKVFTVRWRSGQVPSGWCGVCLVTSRGMTGQTGDQTLLTCYRLQAI